jgi:hypothetical protein
MYIILDMTQTSILSRLGLVAQSSCCQKVVINRNAGSGGNDDYDHHQLFRISSHDSNKFRITYEIMT